MFDDVLHIVSLSFLLFFWCPCMAISNVSVQYNGGLLPDIILLIQCYFHRGTRPNAIKRLLMQPSPEGRSQSLDEDDIKLIVLIA